MTTTVQPFPKIEHPSLRFVPVGPGPGGGGLSYCVAVSRDAGAESEPLILLRSSVAARVYLGAAVDAQGGVVEWLEIWVQSVAGLADSASSQREYISNATLDAKWARDAGKFAGSAPAFYRHTGWETQHPPPLFVDLASGEMYQPSDVVTGRVFRLCTDDAKLRAAGLESYSRTLHRYWLAEDETGAAPIWVAATLGKLESGAVVARERVLPAGRQLVEFNPEGGLLHIRRLAPLSLGDYTNVLTGRGWRGLANGSRWEQLTEPYTHLAEWDRFFQRPDFLFMGGRGRAGVFLESFHLRLQLVCQLVRLVADAVRDQESPMLNLGPESFRVELGSTAYCMPVLWSARATLVVPGEAAALTIHGSDLRRFLPLVPPVTSIFQPEFLRAGRRGNGQVRLIRAETDDSGQIVVEGTLVTQVKMRLSASEVVSIKLPLRGATVELMASIHETSGLAAGETRFRSLPQRFDEPVAKQLTELSSKGHRFPGTDFETVPMLGTPCDLHALGVVAVQILLVNERNDLDFAVDRMFSLGRQMAQEGGGRDLPALLRGIVERDRGWAEALGPHQLSADAMSPKQALAWIPEELWWQAIGTVCRFFPAPGGVSYCKDFNDFSPLAVDQVFASPLADLEELVRRSRGLLFCDWPANREVAVALQTVARQLAQ